jgi:hypothetical protein
MVGWLTAVDPVVAVASAVGEGMVVAVGDDIEVTVRGDDEWRCS